MSLADKQFVQWFYDEQYSEPNYNRNYWMREYFQNTPDQRNFWMREAFLAGYRAREQNEIQELEDWIREISNDWIDNE